jgi:chromate transporter
MAMRMSEVSTAVQQENSQVSLLSLFLMFLKIGSTAFGGFMALISVVQNYVVDRKKLVSHELMMDGISLATILPGPVAVNVVAYTGYQIRGLAGALVCTTAVIIPAFILITSLSYVYFTWGAIPSVTHIFNGFMPAVAAIILSAAINMGKKSLSSGDEYAMAILAALLLVMVGGFFITLAIIVFSGVVGFLVFRTEQPVSTDSSASKQYVVPVAGAAALGVFFLLPYLKASASLGLKLFATFSGMSLLLFGGGYVFIPLIQDVVVDTQGWVSHREFIDGIALGQVTPGPILISAAFIGFKVAGIAGALVSTLGIFTPPAILMLVCTSLLDTIRKSHIIKAVLKGIRCAVTGMIAAAAYVIAMASEHNFITVLIFAATLYALMKTKLEVAWIIPLAGLAGFIYY